MAVERQREYETIYILRPTADDQVRSTTSERVKGIVTGAGGHVLTFDDWGSRRLSYRIKDPVDARYHEQGIYQYFRFLAPNDVVAEVERQLRILDTVISFLDDLQLTLVINGANIARAVTGKRPQLDRHPIAAEHSVFATPCARVAPASVHAAVARGCLT